MFLHFNGGVFINANLKLRIKIKLFFVAILMAVVLLAISILSCFLFFDGYTSLETKKRSTVVFENILEIINEKSFAYRIGTAEFIQEKRKLHDIRIITDLNALYTIKANNNGEIVYNSSSFRDMNRNDGEIIEDKLLNGAKKALSGETVHIKNVKLFDDFEVTVYMYPVINGEGRVIGAICMEFDSAAVKSYALNVINFFMPLILIAIVLLLIACIMILNITINNMIKNISFTDNLTMLKNRSAYEEKLKQLNKEISDDLGADKKIFIVVYDIDDLKIVNNVFGQSTGDACVKIVAEAIEDCFRGIGTTYRTAGDEFSTIVQNCTEEQLKIALDKFEAKEEDFKDINPEFCLSVSFGYADFVNGIDIDLDKAIKRADEKLYRRKKDKKNKTQRIAR